MIAGRERLEAQRDAILYSCSANAAHGQRRTNDDKRRAVLRLLMDAEWSKKSDREIARIAFVDNSYVSRLRPRPSVDEQQMAEPTTREVTRGGTTYGQNVTNIGRRPSPEPEDDADDEPPAAMPLAPAPPAPLS